MVGFVVGVLPGAGATIASAMTYSMEKRLAGASGHFGEGDIRGVAAPEAANNASAAGSFVPMLTLGVPGSGTTAVMVGALSLYNITPGPALFTQNPTLVWGLIASLFVANVILLVINIPLVGVFTKVLQLPNWLLVPGILAVSAVGVYSVHATTFDLLLMSGFGVVGFLLRKQGVPMAPLILGFVLGDLMEQNLRRALSITNGEVGILFESPISKGLWIGAAAMVDRAAAAAPAARRRPHGRRATPALNDWRRMSCRSPDLLYGAPLLKLVDFPTAEVLGPDASEDQIQELIKRHGQVFVKPLFKGGVGKKGKSGLIGRATDLRGALAEKERLYFAEHRHGNATAKANGVTFEGGVPAEHEVYFSITDDTRFRAPTMTITHRGGVDIEELDKSEIATVPFDALTGPEGLRGRQRARPTSARRARSSRRWCSTCPSCGS